jgi:hypothetical protein
LVRRLVRVRCPAAGEELRSSAADHNNDQPKAPDKPLSPSLQDLPEPEHQPTDGQVEGEHPSNEQRDQQAEGERVRPIDRRVPESVCLERAFRESGQAVEDDHERPCGDEQRRNKAQRLPFVPDRSPLGKVGKLTG